MNIFITGGTSGIGLALARFYAAKGHRVGVCGRNTARIDRSDEVNKLLLAYQLDVCDKDALTVAVEMFCADKGLDMMIVAAGYYRNISPSNRVQYLRAGILSPRIVCL